MESPDFHITFVPKQGNAVKHIENLIKKDKIGPIVKDILERSKIKAERISIEETESGKGSEGDVFEGFDYKKYVGKLSGEKKKFLSKEPFIARFELSLLRSRTRDGLMIKNLDQHSAENSKIVAEGLFKTLLNQIGQQGPVPFTSITRTGTF